MFKRLISFGSVFVLSLASLLTIAVPAAFAASISWSAGATGDMNTGSNWTGSSVPGSVDTAQFTSSGIDRLVTNTGTLTFGGITFDGSGIGEFSITGNAIALNGDITVSQQDITPVITAPLNLSSGTHTINVASGSTLVLTGIVGGSGANITKTGTGTLIMSGNNTYTGAVTVSAGTLEADHINALGTTAGATAVSAGASLSLFSCSGGSTFAEDLSLTGASADTTGDFPQPKLLVTTQCSGGGIADESYGYTADNSENVILSGSITLGSDVTLGLSNKTTLTGALSGAYSMNIIPGYGGQLAVNGSSNTTSLVNGSYSAATFKKTLSDSQPSSSVDITGTSEITITGSRGDVSVSGSGKLKGTGTVADLSMSGGTVAPGMSPGVLNSGDLTLTGGTIEEEIGGTANGEFDQLNVTGTVALGTATTLTTTIVNGFTPAIGNSFVIINNDGADAVTGTFSGLAEGATLTVSGYTFRINYAAGSGNDVVLTVTAIPAAAAPAAPNTGFNLLLNNPLTTLGVTALSVAGAIYMIRKQKLATVRQKS